MQDDPKIEKNKAERTLEMSGRYADVAKDVAHSRELPVLDLWTKFQDIADWQSLLSDGLHLTEMGNEAVYTLLMDLIKNELPHFR